MSTQTINIWEGNGSTNAFSFSFDNYDPDFVKLEGYVKDLTGTIDTSYTWEFDPLISNQVVLKDTQSGLDKNLATGYKFTLAIDVDETLPVWYDANAIDINDDTLNTSNISLINNIQAVKDHRTNPRIQSEDMNNQRIVNLAPGVDPNDAVTQQQLSDGIGNIDALVQRAEDAADESELYRDESLAASVDSANSAAAALASEQDAEAAADRANTMFKGEWETDYPNGTDTGYLIGDTVLYQNNQYKSIVNNNTSVPTSTLNTEWLFYLPGAVSSEAQAASFFQTYLQGDGVETDFDLTAINPTWTPKIDDNVFLVLVNGETDLDWTIVVDNNGHSILRFLTAPAESNDTNKNNIFVVGGSPNITLIDDPMPVGSIIPFSVETLPQGFLECDGSTVQAATYPELVSYLTGDPLASQAVLPDLRGVTLRGLDSGRGLDAGRLINTYQEDDYKEHKHGLLSGTAVGGDALGLGDTNYNPDGVSSVSNQNANTYYYTTRNLSGKMDLVSTEGGTETRMKNHSVVYAIKAFGVVVNAGGIDLNGLEQDVLNNTNDINTLNNSFDVNLSANGYQKLPSGLILQWGVNNNTGSTNTVTFPIAFPNSCFVVSASLLNNSSSAYDERYVRSFNSTQATFTTYSSTGAMSWIALGY